MTKTYLELTVDVVVAMVNKGYLRMPAGKAATWKDGNKQAIEIVTAALNDVYHKVSAIPRSKGS